MKTVSHLDLEQFRKYYSTITIPNNTPILNLSFLSMYGQTIEKLYILENKELYVQFDDIF